MAKPILTLEFEDRQQIVIAGETYDILGIDALSLEDSFRFTRLSSALRHVENAEDDPSAQIAQLSEEEIKRLGEACRDLCDRLLQAPEEVKSKLSDMQRMKILRAVFSQPAGQRTPPAQTQTGPGSSPSSPGCNGSTEAIPKTG